jgi:hypothetical protein
MWSDYIPVLPSVAAVINGFIALLVAQFFKEHPRSKAVLVGSAFLLGLASVGGTIYAQSRTIADKHAAHDRTVETRNKLGEFLLEANDLMLECQDGTKPPPP